MKNRIVLGRTGIGRVGLAGTVLGGATLCWACAGEQAGNESNPEQELSTGGIDSTIEDDTGGATSAGSGSGGNSSGGANTGGSPAGGGSPDPSSNCTGFSLRSPWNTDISSLPVHPLSDAYVESVGRSSHLHPDFGTVWEGAPIGIPFVEVDASTERVAIDYTDYGNESDPGPFPIPLDAPIEGGPESSGDRHVLAIDREQCVLYELFHAFPQENSWQASSGAQYDLRLDDDHPEGCTSADAAGLAIFPGLVRYEEVVEQGEIRHALRFTVQNTQRAYIYPARHFASSLSDETLPPMGLRFRMKQDYECGGYSAEVQVICRALKAYGMLVADNGSDWFVSGAPDSRWNDEALGDLKEIPGDAFEVVDTGDTIVTNAPACVIP